MALLEEAQQETAGEARGSFDLSEVSQLPLEPALSDPKIREISQQNEFQKPWEPWDTIK